MTSFAIPASTTVLSEQFEGCNSLIQIQVNSSNPKYSSDSFGVLYNKGKTQILYVPVAITGHYDVPSTITAIEEKTFQDRTALHSVTIPGSVTSIGANAFRDCDSLSEITLPNNLQHIGGGAFAFCVSLEEITFPDGLLTIGASAFERCNALTEVVVPESVTTIGNYVFNRCTALRRAVLPAGVTSIGADSFSRCPIVSSVRKLRNAGICFPQKVIMASPCSSCLKMMRAWR
jgi:hypothetical protein